MNRNFSKKDLSETGREKISKLNSASLIIDDFMNSEEQLRNKISTSLKEQKNFELKGIVEGLSAIMINTESDRQLATVKEFLEYTGLNFSYAYQTPQAKTYVLKDENNVDLLITSRLKGENPHYSFNVSPKTKHLPNTRVETFVFETKQIKKYFSIQKTNGTKFLTEDIVEGEDYYFIQTLPSKFTGNSIGLIQWKGKKGCYFTKNSKELNVKITKPDKSYLKNICRIDHAATRVQAQHRDAAILEFISLTGYHYDFAIYVKSLNSITNVTRITKEDFAMVFTSGINTYTNDQKSGPTEKFIQNYGPRVHHLAFETEHIDETFKSLKKDGLDFMIDLVGSRNEGLKQTFSEPSSNTLLVNEYIKRYDGFDGFFTKSNVTLLTATTDKQ